MCHSHDNHALPSNNTRTNKKGITDYVFFVAKEQTLNPKGKGIKDESQDTANINIESLGSNI